jgi:hypothetical protein
MNFFFLLFKNTRVEFRVFQMYVTVHSFGMLRHLLSGAAVASTSQMPESVMLVILSVGDSNVWSGFVSSDIYAKFRENRFTHTSHEPNFLFNVKEIALKMFGAAKWYGI